MHGRGVHDDVFQGMKDSFEESLSPDVAQRCVDFWYSFVEPFFGLPPRPKEAAVKVGPPLKCHSCIWTWRWPLSDEPM